MGTAPSAVLSEFTKGHIVRCMWTSTAAPGGEKEVRIQWLKDQMRAFYENGLVRPYCDLPIRISVLGGDEDVRKQVYDEWKAWVLETLEKVVVEDQSD